MPGRARAATRRRTSLPARCCRRSTMRRSRSPTTAWSISASRSPMCGARPTGAPTTRWCVFAPSPNQRTGDGGRRTNSNSVLHHLIRRLSSVIRSGGTLMAAQKGKDLLIKINDGTSFVTVAGLRTRRLAFNAETVDITHAESAGRWRELLEGAGVKRAVIAGRGLFKDAATDALMRQTFFDGAVKSYQIVIPDFGTVEGAFQISSLEFAGEHNGEVTYELSLESAGALTFAAL